MDDSLKNFTSEKNQSPRITNYMIPLPQQLWNVTMTKNEQISGCQELMRGLWGGSRWLSERGTRGLLVVIEMFCILTLSMTISWLWNCATRFRKSNHWRHCVKVQGSFCIISRQPHVYLHLSQNKIELKSNCRKVYLLCSSVRSLKEDDLACWPDQLDVMKC